MITTPLLPHQRKALKYLTSHDPCALFMKMGLGKSLVALAYAEKIGAKHILITSDKNNTLNTWPDQIYQHTDYDCSIRTEDFFDEWYTTDKVHAVCVNYDYLKGRTRLDGYIGAKFDLWIGDESSEFKSQWSDRHKALAKVVANIPHKIILNGEPMTEKMEDLFGQFKILDGGHACGHSLTQFRAKYMKPSFDGYGWEPKRSAMTKLQRDVKDISYWLMKSDVRMPEKEYATVKVDMTAQQKKLDDELKEWFAAKLGEDRIEVKHAAALFIKRIQLAGGIFHSDNGPREVNCNKIRILTKLIEQNPEAKIAVWHQYIAETAFLHKTLVNYYVDHLIYDDTNNSAPLHEFKKMDTGVLLIRNSMCKGLNQLADVDIAVIYSNPLSYRTRSQLEGRSQRMDSTTNTTHVVDILTKGGPDEVVYSMLQQKKDMGLTLKGLRAILDHNMKG